ncbi:MerR family DNA-binding protein [uncultured Sphingomonas sp.]|uniref:MerR family DNA-binding protein n=1 Tax=uncultured Sphingomonas sp. TaxID=158754 RepID=UPI0026161CE8|nr:MerR family DNA-binding protein [uncultured Sphingomonas sp.]
MVRSQVVVAMTIGALAKAGGVGVETVRYYQRRGLIGTPPRGGHGIDGGVRRYDAEALRRLRFIRSAQGAGFTLDEIAGLLALDAGEDRAAARALAERRIVALDAKIAELAAARESLARLARSCAAGEGGGCPIITAFEE